ncbi:ABC transporter permease [Prauserella marina]|nr:ABC transporter permease subunit [Prauserella marina]
MTWRQHRVQILVTAAFLAALGIALLVHGISVSGALGDDPSGARARDRFTEVSTVLGWFPLVPLLIGIFWGVPVLAGEYERATHKLAWTQSVSRGRWLLAKLGGLAAVVVITGLAFGAMISAWLGVFDGTGLAGHRFADPGLFTVSGVVPAAWWLFAFTLGVAAGAVAQRVLPALAITVGVFAVALFLFMTNRDGFAAPRQLEVTAADQGVGPDTYLVGSRWLDGQGREIDGDAVDRVCVPAGAPLTESAYYQGGCRQLIEYQPADRYWLFQLIEAGILLTVTAAFVVTTVLRVHRRTPTARVG